MITIYLIISKNLMDEFEFNDFHENATDRTKFIYLLTNLRFEYEDIFWYNDSIKFVEALNDMHNKDSYNFTTFEAPLEALSYLLY